MSDLGGGVSPVYLFMGVGREDLRVGVLMSLGGSWMLHVYPCMIAGLHISYCVGCLIAIDLFTRFS